MTRGAAGGLARLLGRTSRTPTLWIYAENDKFFRPALAHRLHAEFGAAGGRAEFVDAPAFGDDGHLLFSAAGASIWTPMVDRFLRQHHLGRRDPLAAPAVVALEPPPGLGQKGRDGFAAYLRAAPHKALAAAPKGSFGYRGARRSADEARQAALAECAKYAPDCVLVAVDDERVAGSR
jgi:hypothetical protein